LSNLPGCGLGRGQRIHGSLGDLSARGSAGDCDGPRPDRLSGSEDGAADHPNRFHGGHARVP